MFKVFKYNGYNILRGSMTTNNLLRCVDDSGAEGELYALDRGKWRELRRTQGKDKGKPYSISENQILKLPSFCIGKKIRIFVEETDDSSNTKIPE